MKKLILLCLVSLLCACNQREMPESSDDMTFEESTLNMKVTFLDVGQADCTIIESNDSVVLIDGGNDNDGALVVETLLDMQIHHIDSIIATHPHEDHIGGLDDVIDAFDVDNVIMAPSDTQSHLYIQMMESIHDKNVEVIDVTTVDQMEYPDFSIEFIYCDSQNEDTNDQSIILTINQEDVRYFFGADASYKIEKAILKDKRIEDIDIYKVSHHGSYRSSSDELLDIMDAQIGIISCAKDNEYGYPHDKTLKRLNNHELQLFTTATQGSIECTSDGSDVSCEALNDVYTNKEVIAIGNKNSKLVHSLQCTQLPNEDNQVHFLSKEAIEVMGYHPHKECMQ